MTVLRILSNLAVNDPERGVAFYQDFLGLERAMDHGWIVTFAAGGTMMPQVNLAREGGGGAPFRTCRSRWMMWTSIMQGRPRSGSISSIR